tara:strand:+ start:487 stop:678 length:192 start_codon:yes stop_codon:yes gene_type:complete
MGVSMGRREMINWNNLLFEIRNPWTANTIGEQQHGDDELAMSVGVRYRLICGADGIINRIPCY